MTDGFRRAKRNIFVVDDDPAVTASLKFLLEIEDYCVSVFMDAAGLLDARELPSCHCLVVDYYLPGTNGIDVIAAARTKVAEKGRKDLLPAILITPSPPESLRNRAANVQVHLVEKPFKDDGVLEAVRNLLANHAE